MVQKGLAAVVLAGSLVITPFGKVWAQGAQTPATGAGAGSSSGQAQTGGGGGGRRGQYAGMGRIAGEVTAVAGMTVTIKAEDGTSAQVVLTDNTRVMKDRGPVKAADLHTGDGLIAMGNLDAATHTLHAAVVMATDAAQVRAMRENLGKTYIAGRVTAVDLDNARMTVERGDRVAQTIGFDETTSFKRAVRGERGGGAGAGGNGGAGNGAGPGAGGGGFGGGGGMAGMGAMADGGATLERTFSNGESITLADIKVGDNVVGTGSVKAGVFVPVHLLDSPRRQRANGGTGGGTGSGATAGPGTGPVTGPGGR